MARRPVVVRNFEPNQLASEIVGATLVRAQEREIGWLALLMQEVADVMTSTFFQRMASFMGTESSMIAPSGVTTNVSFVNGRRLGTKTQNFGLDGVRATGPGAQPWKPLSQRYAQYKGTDKFWIFKNARNAVRDQLRKKSHRKRVGLVDRRRPGGRIFGTPLKEWTAKRNSLGVLGGAQVTPGSAGYFVRTTGSASGDATPLRFEVNEGDAEGRERRIRKRIPIVFKLFPKLTDLARPENTLLRQQQGQEQVTKLLGKPEWHRPLMRPLLAYYQQVLIRRAWDDALQQTGLGSSAASATFRRSAVNITAERNATQRAAKAARKERAKSA